MKEEVYHKRFEIHSYDTDTTGQLSFVSLARYLQDVASFHADRLGLGYDYLLTENKVWVLRLLKIETCGRAQWKDAVMIETWPKMPDRLLAWRDFLVSDGKGRRIAKATSAWLLIDVKNRRPVRMEQQMFGKYHFRESNVFEEKPGSLPKTEPGEKIYETTVRYSRLDMNGHVNNAEFTGWVTDAWYRDHPQDHYPGVYKIQYDHEVFAGDVIGIYRKTVSQDESLYSVIRMNDGQRAAVAVIR